MGYQADCPFFPNFFFFKDVPSNSKYAPTTHLRCLLPYLVPLQTSVSRQDTRHDERGGGGGMWHDSKTGWVDGWGGVRGWGSAGRGEQCICSEIGPVLQPKKT